MFRASLTSLLFLMTFPVLRAEPVALVSDRARSTCLVTEEDTTIEAKDGKMQANLGNLPIQGSASALLRDRLTRTAKSADEQRITFHECTRSIAFTFSNKAPSDPKLSAGQLTGKTLTAKREGSRWEYALTEDKTTDIKTKKAEENAIKQFGAFEVAVQSLTKLYGTEPREIGQPWRPDFSELSKKYPGLTVTIDCRLDEVAEREGNKIARLTVGGLVTGEYGEKNRIEVRFTGAILRSLRDQIDTDVALTGTLRFQGALGKADEEGNGKRATLEVPLTLKRQVKIAKDR